MGEGGGALEILENAQVKLGKLQFPGENPLPLSDVDKFKCLGVFNYAGLKYN